MPHIRLTNPGIEIYNLKFEMNLKTAKLSILASIFVCIALFVFTKPAWAASLSLSPATASKNVDDLFAVDIVLDTEGVAVSGATAIIDYDTAKLQVQDDNSSATGVNIEPGANLTQVLTNTVDTSAGQIRYDAGNLGASYTGRGVIATIHFKAIDVGIAQASFVFTSGQTTNTSAVAAASGPTSLLTRVNDGNFTISEVGTTSEPLPATGVVEDTLMVLGVGGAFLMFGLFFAKKALRGV
jgi:hypothetical protein